MPSVIWWINHLVFSVKYSMCSFPWNVTIYTESIPKRKKVAEICKSLYQQRYHTKKKTLLRLVRNYQFSAKFVRLGQTWLVSSDNFSGIFCILHVKSDHRRWGYLLVIFWGGSIVFFFFFYNNILNIGVLKTPCRVCHPGHRDIFFFIFNM